MPTYPGFWGDALLTKREEQTLLALAARTADVNSATVESEDYVGALIVVNCTDRQGAASVIPKLQFLDPVDGTTWHSPSAAFLTAFAAAGSFLYLIHPGAANNIYFETKQTVLPKKWRIFFDHAEGSSITYSVAAVLLR